MKFNQTKNWLMIAGLLFLVFPQAGQAGWFDNNAENAINYYKGYNRAIAQYAVPYKTTTNTVTDTSVSDLEDEIDNLKSQINSLNAQINNLDSDSSSDQVDSYVGFATYVTTPMKQDLDAAGYDIEDVGNLYSDEIHVGPAMPGKITAYIDNTSGGAIRGTASGTYTRGGFFDAYGSDAIALYAISSSTDSYAGFFDGNVKIENGQLRIESDSTDEPLYVTSNSGAIAGRFESYNSDAVYGVAMDDYNNAAHFRHLGNHGSALHAVAYASSSRAGLFEGNVFIEDGSLEIRSEWSDPALTLTANGNGPALRSYGKAIFSHGNVSITNFSKLGIGIETPNKLLHIYSNEENAEIDIQSGDNTHWGIYQDGWSGDMLFWNEGNRVIFTDYGYVGIGTTTPEHNLDVAGDVNAFEYCLNNTCINDWEDLADILGISTSTIPF